MLVMTAVMVARVLRGSRGRGSTRRRMIVLATDVHPRQSRLHSDKDCRQQEREQRMAGAVHHGPTGVHYCPAAQAGQ